jgi:hypothetical protein
MEIESARRDKEPLNKDPVSSAIANTKNKLTDNSNTIRFDSFGSSNSGITISKGILNLQITKIHQ